MKAQQPTLLNLLGVAQIIPETPTGKTAQAGVPGVFDMIFQSFMAEPISTPVAELPNPEGATVDQASNAFSAQSETLPIDEPLGGLTNESSLPTAQDVTGNFAISPIKLPRILEAITNTLPQGSYSVTATTIENGVVTFDLSSDNTGKSLQVSIPLESIDAHIAGSMNRGQQSNGNFATIRDGIDIEQLLARANVTSIDISTTPNAGATQSVIAINANQHGKAISLFATPRPAEIVAQALPAAPVLRQIMEAIPQQKVKPAALQVSKEMVTAGLVPTNELAEESSPILDSSVTNERADSIIDSERSVAVATKSEYVGSKTNTANLKPTIENQWGQKTQADSANKDENQTSNNLVTNNSELGDTTSGTSSSTLTGATLHRTETTGMHTTHSPNSALVKNPTSSDFGTQSAPEITASFTLPKDLEAMTLHAGRTNSVTLQLSPEHLGTARVHLTVQNDIVSARVVVDSHHAKAVVEGSLNELLTQFERANIRVEQIQVAVGGEWQNSEHNRRQFWHAPRQSTRFMEDSGDGSDSISGAVAKLFTPKQTPAFAGLNILA